MHTDCIRACQATFPRVAASLLWFPVQTVCLGALHIERSIEGECFCFS